LQLAVAGDADGRLASVSSLFLRLGATAFGGPAVYIAMMRDEVVSRRRWMRDDEFLDLVGATNLIPGPNATEMAAHIGRLRAGWPGLLLAGACFTAPAIPITLAFAWIYVRYGSTPGFSWLLYGIKPVVIGVMAQAIWNMGRASHRNAFLAVLGASVLALYLAGFNEIALLFGAGAVAMLASNVRLRPAAAGSMLFVGTGGGGGLLALFGAGSATAATTSFSMAQMFFTFLKIGSVMYGSGYVLVTFLRADFVERLGWLTEQQLLDAVAAGQMTPGPLLSTATFIGYVLGGWDAALLATVAIFLPSFVFVALSGPLIPLIRRSPWTSSLLDGVNVAAVALMAGATWQLGRDAVIDPVTGAIALAGAALLIRFRVNSSLLVLLGGGIGVIAKGLGA